MTVEESDVIYAREGKQELLARLYRTQSGMNAKHGIVMVHGGAWNLNDRFTPQVVCRALAEYGLVVLSLDFRCGPDFKHPAASRDVAAGIRYARSNAAELGIDRGDIGLIGSSSGGHLALLTAIRPDAAEHQGVPVAQPDGQFVPSRVTAQVSYVVALWPVSNPLQRYRYALEVGRRELAAMHRNYFGTESVMEAASVQRVLRAGEAEHLPPALVVQPGEDANVPRAMTLDLIDAYQEAGGELEYLFVPGQPHAYAYEASKETSRLMEVIQGFIQRRRQVESMVC